MLTYHRRGEGSVEVDRALELDTRQTSENLYFLIFKKEEIQLSSKQIEFPHFFIYGRKKGKLD